MDASESARKLTNQLADRESSPREVSPSTKPAGNPSSDLSLEGIRHFFDESEFDIYTKENIGPESYRLPGEPCHGGYATEPKELTTNQTKAKPDTKSRK